MTFVRKDWKDLPDETTPISAAALEDLETRLLDYTDAQVSATGYDTVQEEGAPLTQRPKLNFVGAGITATDDTGNNRTNVTVPGVVIQEEGLSLTQHSLVNFIGPSVTAVDDLGNSRTNVTIVSNNNTIQDEGSNLTTRQTVNFIGLGVAATDDSGNSRTNVTISGGYTTIQDEASPLTQRGTINFIGPFVTATDDAGNTRTLVTITAPAVRQERTWALQGTLTVSTLPGFFVSIPANRAKKALKVRYKATSGSFTFYLRLNGSAMTGFGTSGSPLSATTTATTTDPTDVTLAENDYIDCVIVASTSGVDPSITLVVEES